MSEEIKAARKVMFDEFQKDPEFRETYKANIAMKIWDLSCINGKRRLSAKKCNEIADNLIGLIFSQGSDSD